MSYGITKGQWVNQQVQNAKFSLPNHIQGHLWQKMITEYRNLPVISERISPAPYDSYISHYTHWGLVKHVCIINSLAPGRFQFNFRLVIFKLNLVNGGWGISYEIALRWMPLDLTVDKSTLVQVMAWCHQATSHYLGQCWPRSMSPNGVTRPRWIKLGNHWFR